MHNKYPKGVIDLKGSKLILASNLLANASKSIKVVGAKMQRFCNCPKKVSETVEIKIDAGATVLLKAA